MSSVVRSTNEYHIVLRDRFQGCYFGAMHKLDGAVEGLKSFTVATRLAAFDLGSPSVSTDVQFILFLKNSNVG